MNLLGHSASIHSQLQKLKDMSQGSQHELLGDWLRNLFKSWGTTRWLQEFTTRRGILLLLIVLILTIIPCTLNLCKIYDSKAV